MQMGKVIGTVVASRKEELLEGMKFLVVRQLNADNEETGVYVVAVDAVGAGVGIRWQSPVGPFRIDIAPPIRDPDDSSGVRLHLSLGPEL